MKSGGYKLILLLLFVIIAMGIFLFRSADNVIYRTDKITRGDIKQIVTATGTVNPVELVNIGTQVSGQVKRIYVKVGQRVKKSQLLAEIDDSVLQAQLKQSHSALETALFNYQQAGRELNRNQALVKKNYIAEIDFEHAQQVYISAKNSYNSAQSRCIGMRSTSTIPKYTHRLKALLFHRK